jgi:hypothetical protein
VPCVLVLVPRVGRGATAGERRHVLEVARQVGFARIVDLTDAYDGIDPADLAIGPDDFHPNADGHARLARRLAAELGEVPASGAGGASP